MSKYIYLFVGNPKDFTDHVAFSYSSDLRENIVLFGSELGLNEVQDIISKNCRDYIIFEVTDRVYSTTRAPSALEQLFKI